MSHRHVLRKAASRAAVCLMLPVSIAIANDTQQKPDTNAAAEFAKAGLTPEQPLADYNTIIKDMQKSEGMITLFRYKADDPTKDHTRLLAQIPKALLGQDLLFATSISRGEMMGFQWTDSLMRFEQVGRKIMMSTPDTRFVQTPGQPVTDAVSRTYTPTFLAALPIVAMSPQGDPLVDLGSALMSRMAQPPGVAAVPGMGPEIRRDLSRYTKVKVFPENILIDVDLALSSRNGGGSNIGVSYAFRKLPDLKSYSPRVADERVGYFTTVRQDWNMKHTERENIVRYINRWDLQKKDPSLELSPPVKPIVFVIEKTVPLQWRKYVAEGILEWNKAFEKVGIVGAIVVQQQTDDNEFAEIDPEDARYNFIRWIVTGMPFAMGPSRPDPRTGQILDADIIFDDSMLRYFGEEMAVLSPGPVASSMGPELLTFLRDNPAYIPMGVTLDDVNAAIRATSRFELLQDAVDAPGRAVRPQSGICNFASGLRHQLAMMNLLVQQGAAPGRKIPEKLLGAAIRETVAHEVGHTLGLRHNFKASAWLPQDEIKKRRDTTDEPTTASVMDYNAMLFFPGDELEKVRILTTPTIGPYDYWAIEYGYRIPGKDEQEKKMLSEVAQLGTKREHAYQTDEDTMGLSSPDPQTNRWDMSADPLAWAKSRIELCDQLLKNIADWAVAKDEPNYYLRQAFSTVMFEKMRNFGYVARLVGGQEFNRNRASDPDAKPAFVLVDPQTQREALSLLGSTIFADDFFRTEASLLNQLGPSRWWDWSSTPSARLDYPVHQSITSMQSYALLNVTSPMILQRVYDAELKSTSEEKFTAAELIGSVKQVIWGDLAAEEKEFTDSRPMISSVRRNLQKQWLSNMIAALDARPGSNMSPDLQSMIAYTLRELSGQIAQVLEKSNGGAIAKIDFASRAHLSEARNRIERVLNAPHMTPQAPAVLMMSPMGSMPPAGEDRVGRD
jgi:hypothetical protein